MNPAFFYFQAGGSGNIDIAIDPIDPFTGVIMPMPQDLDFICWGPFNSTANMCNQLQATNRVDCSQAPGTTAEMCNIPGAVVGDIYVILVVNWADPNPPNACNIRFTADTINGGIPNPFTGGGFAGANATIFPCNTDPAFDMTTRLNGFPDSWGTWLDASNNPVPNMFDPANDPGGIYKYVIGGTANCPGDTAFLTINLINSSNVIITSSSNSCSNDAPLTLTASPSGGIFSGNGVVGNTFTPNSSLIGTNIISYEYSSNGCTVTVTQNLTVDESPFVPATNITINNPTCFGYSDGSAIVIAAGGGGGYTYNWFGQNPLALPAGIHNYIVTDINNCTFSSSVTLYNPINNIATLTPYNSTCYGDNTGAVSVNMIGGTTPPGTISTLNYCASSPNPDPFFTGQAATIIEEVSLVGDNNNINNNTAGTFDTYEDYTATMYADITEGQSYTINITPSNQAIGSNTYDPGQLNVYIDFNIDGDFDDVIAGISENIGVINIPTGWTPGTVYPFNITVPNTGAYGATRMRVVCIDISSVGAGANLDDCTVPSSTFGPAALPWWGATEDYSIVLNAPTVSANYLWANGSTADSIYNLGPGTYTVTITPSSGCAVQDSVVITESNNIAFNPTITNVSCNSLTDGTVILSPTGGMDNNYSYNWYGFNPLALDDGSYNVTVTDNFGCSNDTIISITEPSYFSVNFTTSANEICLNDSVALNFDFNTGGISPFSIDYTINGIVQTPIGVNNNGPFWQWAPYNLGNNTYAIVTITDATGCPIQNTILPQNILVNPNPDIGLAISGLNPICFGDSSSIFFTNISGNPPFNVAYNINGIYETENVGVGGSNVIVSPDFTTTYTLDSVSDINQCTSYLSDNVTIIVNELPELSWSVPNNVCDEEIVQLTFEFTAGSPPWNINYNVNGNNYAVPLNNSIDSIAISPSSTSIYTVVSIIDNNGCKQEFNEDLTIVTHPLPIGNISGGGSLCNDGSTTDIAINITAGTPPFSVLYAYGVNTELITNVGVSEIVSTNTAGTYSLLNITDKEGCQAKNLSGKAIININPIPNAEFTVYPQPADILNPIIYFSDISNGHSSGLWNFDNGNTLSTNFGEVTHLFNDTGSYRVSLIIESDSGCIDTAWKNIIISPVFTVYIPNAFSPNNDLDNNYFLPVISGVVEYEFSVYNRQGQKIFYTNETNVGWDGNIDGSNQQAMKGVYVYAITLKDFNGKIKTYEGTVTLIR